MQNQESNKENLKKETTKSYNNQPIIKTRLRMSENREWFIVQKTETTIFPASYLSKVITGSNNNEDQID